MLMYNNYKSFILFFLQDRRIATAHVRTGSRCDGTGCQAWPEAEIPSKSICQYIAVR